MPAERSQRISMSRLLIYSLLCGALAWVAVAVPRQTQTKFFLNDDRFMDEIHVKADAALRKAFFVASARYLRPFAKTLLALAVLREKQTDVARTQLTELVADFPQPPLFASELAKLNAIPPVSQPHSLGLSMGTVRGASNFERAILTAVTACMDAVGRVHSGQGFAAVLGATPSAQAPEEKPFTIWRLIFYGFLSVCFLILLVTHPSLAIWLLINILSGSRRSNARGGRGWGGGGFSPGGGRSGGGGASSSW